MKRLILNADDFCLSYIFNEVIFECLDEGIISSTSLMIDRYTDSQKEQVARLKATTAGIGLHIEFTSADDFEVEIQRQYDLFKEIIEQEPSHLDIHKSTYLESGYLAVIKFATEKNLPFRNHGFDSENGATTTKESVGAIHNSLDEIIKWLESFNDNDSGELVLHPGKFDPDCITSLNYEREVDCTKATIVKKYCDDNSIEIINFSKL
jgi:predicted glycoside hydrolase/deacetylase ChbG (UPF0249 family)